MARVAAVEQVALVLAHCGQPLEIVFIDEHVAGRAAKAAAAKRE